MKLSEYIEGLQETLNNCGDMECYYSCDEEGNAFRPVLYTGSVFCVEALDDWIEFVYPTEEEYREDYSDFMDEEEIKEPVKICVVN